tara:strand:- start:518 stop:1144 length:627 start_codon:yes stop_codon:yes gene_type:complete
MSRLVVTNIETQNIKFDSDTTAFTIGSDGIVTGNNASAMIKLLSATIGNTSMYVIDSTYINSTYNIYLIQAEFLPVSDGHYLYSDAYVGGSVVDSGNNYGRYVREIGSGDVWNSPGQSEFVLYNRNSLGNATGEGITINAVLQNVNSTTRPACITGTSVYYGTGAETRTANFGGTFGVSQASSIVNGINFYISSGNIASGSITLYGIK